MINGVGIMKSLLASLLFGASLTGFAAAQEAPASDVLQLEGVAALVNDEPITFFDVRQRVRMLLFTLGTQPTEQILQQLSTTALDQLVDERLQLQQAKEFELNISADRINDSIARLAQQSGSNKETLESEFDRNGISMQTLEEQTRADIAWQIIIRERFGKNIRISKDRIGQQMKQFQSDFQTTRYQLAEIFLFAPDPDTKAQAVAGAETLIQQLQQGAPFRAVATQISRAPTAAAGGDMGWVTVEDLDPALVDAVVNTERPGIIGPIVAENGVYILALRGKQEPQEIIPKVSLMQIVAPDGSKSALERAMNSTNSCADLKNESEDDADLIMADLGTIDVEELADGPKALIADISDGEFTDTFEMSRGLATIMLCERKEGAEGLPTDDQVENQLYGREVNMISERELRNMRNDATILR